MGLAEDMNRALHQQLNCHLAWLPIANTFALGDYGVISRGVFTKLGSVSDFGVAFKPAAGPVVKLDFASKETKVTTFAGGVEVDVLSDEDIDVKVKIEFEKASSFLIKAAKVQVKEIQDLLSMMNELQQRPGWQRSFKVVAKVWHAENAALFSTLADKTALTVSGDAPSLRKFQLGDVSADLRTSKDRELGLELVGKSGVIGLGLAQRKFFGDVGFLSDAPLASKDIELVDSRSELLNDDL
jgi:hypothetical protein